MNNTTRLGVARRSWVQTLRGSRRRKWGYLHDRVWFPVSDMEYLHHLRELPMSGEKIVMSRAEAYEAGCPTPRPMRLYLDRHILRLGSGRTLRLHTFYTGDDDSAPHDHPWVFYTFPLDSYCEVVERPDEPRRFMRIVRRFRVHRRDVSHRHYVMPPDEGEKIRTIVFTGRVRRTWGFWPRHDDFVPFPEWTNYEEKR